jgi:hypothetical protein
MIDDETTQAGGLSTRKVGLLLAAICLVTFAWSLFVHRYDIALLKFDDPDDSMRLVQVRDFLAGQSWFDVSQHRANPPMGGPMHWSRLVDLPIAGFILLLRPFVGTHFAEIGAILLVPALTCAALLAALYWAARPLIGKAGALLGCAVFATSPIVMLTQCAAMRIDHHGWQLVMMALVLGGTLHANLRWGGFVAGLAMAIWLHISAEGLPLAVLAGGVMALRYAFDGKEWPRIAHYIWMLVIASAVLLIVTHGWKASLVSYCDAISPAYLVPLAVVPVVMTAGRMLLGHNTGARRLLPIGLAAGIAAAIFLTTSKQCLAGPFNTLDRQVYEFWYEAVMEGLPIWKQSRSTAVLTVIPSLLGIFTYAFIVAREKDASRRWVWLTLFALAVGATGLSIFVARTMSFAHLLAIPGNAWLIIAVGKRARALSSVVLRIPATAALTLLCPAVAVAVTLTALPNKRTSSAEQSKAFAPSEITALSSVAPATLFAPIDISPDILLRTSNSIVGTGHHRNLKGMKLVISAFLAPAEQARDIVLRSSATYLLMAPDTGETNRYRKAAPHGLAADLLAGKPPAWLIPVSLPGLKVLRLYRIDGTSIAQATEPTLPGPPKNAGLQQ